MLVVIPVLLVILAVVLFVACGVLVENDKEMLGTLCCFLGLFLVMVLAISPMWNPSGLPLHNIDPGTYKVGFVYVSGENINVAVEWNYGKNHREEIVEGMVYYQFHRDAFEGTLNSNAKKLVVVQSGNFKKLRLE